MRSLANEIAIQRAWTQPQHATWEGPTATITAIEPARRRAVLRRLLRQGELRAASLRRGGSGPDQQVPADHDRAERDEQPRLPEPAGVAPA